MNRRLLAIGIGGLLGPRIYEYYSNKDGYEVMGVTHRELDIEDFVTVSAFTKATRSNYALHCVAISNIGTCERDPVLSERVNVRGIINLAKAYRDAGSRMTFTSSGQIYNTSHSVEPNRRGSEGKPGNVYGRDKKRAEEVILTYLPNAVALKSTRMYGAPSRGRTASQGLLQKLADALKDRREVEPPVYDYRGIIHMWEMVHHLEEAVGLLGGVYNLGSEDQYNTFDTAGLFPRELVGSDPGDILERSDGRLVSCPRNLAMDTDKIKSCGIRPFNTSEGICKRYMGCRETSRASC